MKFLHALRRWMAAIGPGTGGILPWLGAVLLVIAAGFAAHSWWLTRDQVRATATVTEDVESFGPGGGLLYTPRLRFRTPAGEIVRVFSRHSDDDIEFAAGKIVPVMYPTGDPMGAVIATKWRVYYWGFVFGIWGAIIFDVGLVVRRWRRLGSRQ